jgi:hypothetical protein
MLCSFLIATRNDLKFAKLGAAKKAYDTLTGWNFKYDDIIKGEDCLDEEEFNLVESEQLHIVHAKTVVFFKFMPNVV